MIDSALVRLAPRSVIVGSRRINDGDLTRLWPEELAAVDRAISARRREFATGRVLLRLLLGTDAPIGVQPDRRPKLPEGATGTLAHDDTYVVAAISTDPTVVALGIDIESAHPLAAEDAAIIVRPDEGEIDASLAFVLKEAAYKAWGRPGGRTLEHHDVRVTADSAGTFAAEVIAESVHLDGTYAFVAGRWLALVVVRSSSSSS